MYGGKRHASSTVSLPWYDPSIRRSRYPPLFSGNDGTVVGNSRIFSLLLLRCALHMAQTACLARACSNRSSSKVARDINKSTRRITHACQSLSPVSKRVSDTFPSFTVT